MYVMQLPSNWNNSIQNRSGHILQSAQWANFQTSIGRQPYFSINKDWYWIAYNRQVTGLHYLLATYNPVIEKDPVKALESLRVQGGDLKCDFVRVEPTGNVSKQDLESLGAHQLADVQPSHTLVLDLTRSEEDLRHDLQSGHRNRINTGEKRGVRVYKTVDLKTIPVFLRLMHDTADHSKITNHPDWYYEKMAQNLIEQGIACFYVATVEENPASVSLVFDWGNTRYYAHTGNDQVLNRQYKAAVSCAWQMILDAKSDGKKYFDFWGIAPPEEPNHPWAGISAFKHGFGGSVVSNIGTYDLVINKSKYAMYNAYRKLKGRK